MAVSLFPSNTNQIELDEYLDYVASHVDPDDPSSVEESAPKLKELSNNREFVVKQFNEQLKATAILPTSGLSFYSIQSAILGSEGRFSVRLNVWPLVSPDARRIKLEADLYSYWDAHDHNFTFMTVGYWGSGYETVLYEYDPSGLVGYIGERVDIKFLEKTTLPIGKVMLYRPHRDIHTQLPPKEFSMSLNLMVANEEKASLTHQYYFDVENQCIKDYVESYSTKRVSMVNAMRFIGDESSVDILWNVARRHPCNRTRISAFESLIALKPEEADRVLSAATSDSDELVRRSFIRRAAALG